MPLGAARFDPRRQVPPCRWRGRGPGAFEPAEPAAKGRYLGAQPLDSAVFAFAPELTRKVERLDSLLAAAEAGPGAGGYAVSPGLWHAGAARRRLTAGN